MKEVFEEKWDQNAMTIAVSGGSYDDWTGYTIVVDKNSSTTEFNLSGEQARWLVESLAAVLKDNGD